MLGQKLIMSVISCFFILYCYSQSGSLDTTYGYYGKATCLKNYQGESANIQHLPSGKILVATLDTRQSQLICLNNDGTLDKTFGVNGLVSINLNKKTSHRRDETREIKSTITTPDGKNFVGGFDGDTILLLCFNQNGTPKSDFGVNGVLKIPSKVNSVLPKLQLSLFQGNKILISDNGFAIATDSDYHGLMYNGVVTMRLVDLKGFIATDFGNGGKITMANPVNSFSVRMETDTTILLSAIKNDKVVNKKREIWINKYSYSGSNIKQYYFFDDEVYDPVLIQDNKFLIFGDSSWQQYYLKQYFLDGMLDTTFGKNGISLFSREDNTGLYPSSQLIKIMNHNEILLATSPLVFSGHEICLMKFDNKGKLLTEFGHHGRILTPLSMGSGYGNDKNSLTPKILAWTEVSNGKIIIVAKQSNSPENTSDLITLRYILQ